MKKITLSQVEHFKLDIKSLDKYKLTHADIRTGKKIALCIIKDYSVSEVVTDFMTYKEMYCFLRALYMRENNMI